MSPAALRLYRLVLYAYPAAFRRDYSPEMEQLLCDQHRRDGVTAQRLMMQEVRDAARTAPRLRWETPMNRVVIIALTTTVAVALLLAVGALGLVLIGVIGSVAWLLWGRSPRPIAPAATSRRWMAWLTVGIVSIGIGVAIPQLDGGELSAMWWTIMAITVVGGAFIAVVGIMFAVNHRQHRLASPHTP